MHSSRITTIFAAAALFIIAGVSASAGQSPSKIIAVANRALGGEARLKRITALEENGSIRRISDGASGRFFAAASSPGQFRVRFDIGGSEYSRGYNGKSGWEKDSKGGVRTITGDDAKLFQAESAFRASKWLRAKVERSKLTALPSADINGTQAKGIMLTTAKGIQIKIWFDAVSGLPLRDEIGQRSAEYSDYRLVDGIRTPFDIKMTDADGGDYEIRLDEVKYEREIEASVFEFPADVNEPLPDIPALLSELRANAEKIDDILEDYSYTELRIDRELNSSGQMIEKESEKRLLTFFKGYRINRLIEKDGKPLTASDQEREDREAQKQVAEIEDKITKREARSVKRTGQPSNDGRRISVADALKGSLLKSPRREMFRGRPVIVFDYEPDPQFKPQTRNERLFSICSGTIWVDESLKQVVRLDATLIKSAGNFIAKAKSGASFSIDNELVNNEIWLPSQADLNISIKILFAGININNLIKYGDYRKFSTEVKDVTTQE